MHVIQTSCKRINVHKPYYDCILWFISEVLYIYDYRNDGYFLVQVPLINLQSSRLLYVNLCSDWYSKDVQCARNTVCCFLLRNNLGRGRADNLPSSSRHLSDYFWDQAYPNSFFFDPVTPSEVESEILSTPPNKAYGLYFRPTCILKGANFVVSATLADMMNMSVQIGVYPSKLKHAKVIPVYKTGDEAEPGIYRSISLLSVFNRLSEKLMRKRLTSFIENNLILFKSQYGFRANCFTQHAILDIVNKMQSNMDAGLYSCGVTFTVLLTNSTSIYMLTIQMFHTQTKIRNRLNLLLMKT